MMLYPAMSLLNKYVENRYPLCEKPVTTAINEVAAGKLTAENIDTHIAK